MNNSVSITAIICNFNGAAYLKEAVVSVLAQKSLPDEFIIVDDGSTDDSIDIIKGIQLEAAGLITLIQHDKNRGQAAGMNTAFAASRGEILAFLDSDDIWFSDKLAALRKMYNAQPDAGLFQHNLKLIKDRDMTEELYMPAVMQGDVFELWRRYGTFPFFLPTSALAIRREVFAKVSPLPETLLISADSYMTRSAICFGPLASTLEPLGGYRRHNSNNVYGNDKHNGWQFFLDNVSPLLADFYQSHGIALPALIRPRQNGTVRNKLVDRIMDLNLRKIIHVLRTDKD